MENTERDAHITKFHGSTTARGKPQRRANAVTRNPYLMVVGGGIPGSLFPLDTEASATTLGRSPKGGLRFVEDTISREHARLERTADGVTRIQDLGSTNGTLVNGLRLTPGRDVILRDGDWLQLGQVLVLKYTLLTPYDEELLRNLFDRSIRDGLTGLYRRDYVFESSRDWILQSRRIARGMALVMIDMDRFKIINDKHGHDAGDAVLRKAAEVLRERIGNHSLIGRFGGEEFVALLPADSPSTAQHHVELIRCALAEEVIHLAETQKQLTVTASFGIAWTVWDGMPELSELLILADRALYEAKAGGRNRVILRSPSPQSTTKEMRTLSDPFREDETLADIRRENNPLITPPVQTPKNPTD